MAPYDPNNDTTTCPRVAWETVNVCRTEPKEPEPPPPGWHQLYGGFAYKQDKPRPPKRQVITHGMGPRRKRR